MRHRGWAFLAVVAAAALVSGTTSAAQKIRSGRGAGRKPAVNLPKAQSGMRNIPPGTRSPDVVGTINYDNNVPFSRDGSLGTPIGNRFDNGVSDPHSIAAVSFRLAGCFQTPYPQERITIFDINPTAMTNMNIAAFSGGGACSSGTGGAILRTAMLPAPIVGHNGPFIGAVFNTPFGGCSGNTAIGGTCEGVALSAGGVDPGMGFHAIRVSNGGVTAGNLGTRNAIFRATGDNLPVELMNFGVN